MTERDIGMDDLQAYIATYTPEERQELAIADVAIDIAVLLHRARGARNVSQAELAERIGASQQAISRIEQPNQNVTLETLRKYLSALNYTLEITVKDANSGSVVDSVNLSPAHPQPSRRGRTASTVPTMS